MLCHGNNLLQMQRLADVPFFADSKHSNSVRHDFCFQKKHVITFNTIDLE